jgi:hypothetical protein
MDILRGTLLAELVFHLSEPNSRKFYSLSYLRAANYYYLDRHWGLSAWWEKKKKQVGRPVS